MPISYLSKPKDPVSVHEIEPAFFFVKPQTYTGSAPAFYNTTNFDWIPFIEANWQVIRDEMLESIKNPEGIPIPNYNPYLVDKAKIWRHICFVNYLWKKKKTIKKYPKTWELINKIPNISYAALNMLEPDSSIAPHHGDTNITARCHLGIVIPEGLPNCGMCVGDTKVEWQEGKIFAFSDAALHSAWNFTNKHRFVFVIDVILPQYAQKKELYCSQILSILTLKALSYKVPILRYLFTVFFVPLTVFLSLLWRFIFKTQ